MTDDFEPTTSLLGLGAGFLQQAAEEYEHLQEVLAITDQRIADEQAGRDRLVAQLRALEQLLVDSPTNPTAPEPHRANADAVIDVLTEHGAPMHFREIYAAIAESGFRTGGADPASALLTRFFNDFRLRRVARGTYALDRQYQCIFKPQNYVVDDGQGNQVRVDQGWLGYAWESLRTGGPRNCAQLGDMGLGRGSRSYNDDDNSHGHISVANRQKLLDQMHMLLVDIDCEGRVATSEGEKWLHPASLHLSALLNDLIVGDIKERGEQASFRRVGPVGFATFEATDTPPLGIGVDFGEENARSEASSRERRKVSSPAQPEPPASAEIGTRSETADSPPDTALKVISTSEDGSAKASDRMPDKPRMMIDAALGIFADALAPTIWEMRRLDLGAYRRVQNSDNGALTAADFANKGRWASRQKLKRAMLKDPQKVLKLLKISRRIRVELLGADATRVEHLDTLLAVRGAWAHYNTLSWRQVGRVLYGAEEILRAISAHEAAEQIVALWPWDAA